MKSKINRIISTILIFSFLLTALSVFSFAESSEGVSPSEETPSTEFLTLFYSRDFQEGWGPNEGFSSVATSGNKFTVDREVDMLGMYNYFLRLEAASTSAMTVRFDFGPDTVTHGNKKTIPATTIEFAIKADDVATLGTIMYMKTGIKKQDVNMLAIDANGELVAFSGVTNGDKNLGKLENEWINVAFVFNWLNETAFDCTIKLGYGLGKGYSQTVKMDKMMFPSAGDLGMSQFYIQIAGGASSGMSYCLDNFKIYQGVQGTVDLPVSEYGYGSKIDLHANKVIDIQTSVNDKSKAQLLEEALAMKVGVDYALARNVRYALTNNADNEEYSGKYGAPVKQGDNVLVPLQFILDYIGFPSYAHPDNMSFDITTGTSTTSIILGRDSATIDGERVMLTAAPGYVKNSAGESYLAIAVADISTLFPGWITIYDSMGLIILYEDATPDNLEDNAPLVTRDEDLQTMVDIMKKFVFDTVSGESLADGYVANGELVFNDTKENTNDFAHPYIIADADVFAKLRAKLGLNTGDAGYDAKLKAYIQTIISEADKYYLEYAEDNGVSYQGIKAGKAPVSTYTGDGYSNKGDVSNLVKYANVLPTLAFAYQMTENSKYARLAYDFAVVLGNWSHWGPGNFPQCAEVTSAYAIAYDWLYNAYKALSLDTDVLAEAIYSLGVHDGYVSSSGGICEHPRNLGDLSVYNTKNDSANAVGASGMIIGSLAILDYVSGDAAPEKAYDETIYLIGNNIQSLIQYGLDVYAPDGSYVESATKWEYSTTNLFRMIMALDSAAGTDYGFIKTWGLDKTCYYAIHIESSDGFIWNYNDGGQDGLFQKGAATEDDVLHSLNTEMFYFAGMKLSDAKILAARQNQLEKGKNVTIYDLLFYPFDGIGETPELELDYEMESFDGYVMRSDWEAGAIYTGIMGGKNNTQGAHLDSGNFIYHNKGIVWVPDLGTENPYATGYDVLATRYKYYRASAEGHNIIIVTDNSKISYGQLTSGYGEIVKSYSDEFGAYSIVESTEAYSGIVSLARRGVMLTNNRKTVVLQDELTFKKIESFAWIIHTGTDISIDDSGRVAIFSTTNAEGQQMYVRATIVSLRPDFLFAQRDASSPILSTTYNSSSVPGEPEYSRSSLKRLVIEGTSIAFEAAIVFEYIEDINNMPEVSYSWTTMNNWQTYEKFEGGSDTSSSEKRLPAVANDIITFTMRAENILKKKDTAFTEKLFDLYRSLTNVEYALQTFSYENSTQLSNAYADYVDCVEKYEGFAEYVNELVGQVGALSNSLVGFTSK